MGTLTGQKRNLPPAGYGGGKTAGPANRLGNCGIEVREVL